MFRLDPAHTGMVADASFDQLEVAWSRDLGGSVDSSPAVVGGVVFVGNSLGQMHALSAEDGSVLWQFQASGAVMSSPAVAESLVVFGSVDRFLYALRADSGELAWRYRTCGPIISSPTCADGVVYFTSMGGRAYAISLADGALIWQSAPAPRSSAHPRSAAGWSTSATTPGNSMRSGPTTGRQSGSSNIVAEWSPVRWWARVWWSSGS